MYYDGVVFHLASPNYTKGEYNNTMSTIKASLEFKHDNDCLMSGCPGHKMEVSHQTTSDWFTVRIDDEVVYGGDDNTTRAMLELINKTDYK